MPEPSHLAPSESLWSKVEKHRSTIVIVLVALVFGAVSTRACASTSSSATPTTPQVLSGPTTSTTVPPPPVDPLANLGALTPTAAALVGPDWDARREVARRSAEVMTQTGKDQCSLLMGATVGGSWELSTTYGPAHPVGVFAGCPWPPQSTTTTTKGA